MLECTAQLQFGREGIGHLSSDWRLPGADGPPGFAHHDHRLLQNPGPPMTHIRGAMQQAGRASQSPHTSVVVHTQRPARAFS